MNKLLILTVLTIQTAAHILTVRYTRSQEGSLYLSSSVVTCCELLKLCISLSVIFFQNNLNVSSFLSEIKLKCFSDGATFAKLLVPGLLYTLQNNLLYVGLSNLPAAIYQVLYQMKLLTTAVFSCLMLNKRFSSVQWVSLCVLFLGVILVESDTSEEKSAARMDQNAFLGVTTVVISSITSGFAGVWFERIIKGSDPAKKPSKPVSIWCTNVQLAFIGVVFGFAAALISDSEIILNEGYFRGFTPWVWLVVIFQGVGGIVVAITVQYADSILKAFACAAAIIVACVGAFFLFDFQISLQFLLGTVFVVGAILMYSLPPQTKQKSS